MPKSFLEHHLTVCPKALEISKMQAQPFFNKGVNFFAKNYETADNANHAEESKEGNGGDLVASDQFQNVINTAYERLKASYGSEPVFTELFTVDE